jgi:hypothetical protein
MYSETLNLLHFDIWLQIAHTFIQHFWHHNGKDSFELGSEALSGCSWK